MHKDYTLSGVMLIFFTVPLVFFWIAYGAFTSFGSSMMLGIMFGDTQLKVVNTIFIGILSPLFILFISFLNWNTLTRFSYKNKILLMLLFALAIITFTMIVQYLFATHLVSRDLFWKLFFT